MQFLLRVGIFLLLTKQFYVSFSEFSSLSLNRRSATFSLLQGREMTSSRSSHLRIWKIRHYQLWCSFAWILRVVSFPLKDSCLYNKCIVLDILVCSVAVYFYESRSIFGWVKIQMTSKNIQRYYTLKRLIRDLFSNCFTLLAFLPKILESFVQQTHSRHFEVVHERSANWF